MTKPNRIQWMDAARGLGIVLVVLGHVERGLFSSRLAMAPGWAVLDFTLYTFHMPLFFVLAGFNAPHSFNKGKQPYIINKIQTVAYPYFLWSLLQGFIFVGMSSFTNSKAHIGDLLSIGWRPINQFWFLYALMASHLILLIVGTRPLLLIGVAVIAMGLSQYPPLPAILERILHSLPFFLGGVLLAAKVKDLGALTPGRWPMVAGLWALFGVAVYAAWRISAPNYDQLWSLPAAGLGIAAMIATARLIRGRVLIGFMYLGSASMTIYVLHILAAAGLRIMMAKLGAPPIDWLYALACTAIGLAAPIGVHIALSRLHLLPLFGLAAPRRRLERDKALSAPRMG